MTERQPPATALWQRAQALWKRADRARRVVEATTVVVNPLVTPVAQQARIEPVADLPAIQRDIERDQQKQYAEWELERRKEEAGEITSRTDLAKLGKNRDNQPYQQRKIARSRDWQRDR